MSDSAIMRSPPSIVAYSRTSEACASVSRAAGKRAVRFCSCEDDLPAEAAKEWVTIIVWDAVRDVLSLIPSMARALSDRTTPASVVIQLELSDIGYRLYSAIIRQLPYAIVCLRKFDSLETIVSSLCAGTSERRADSAIIERLVPAVPPTGGNILTAAAICGHGRLLVKDFADAYGMPVRTMELSLERCGIVPPRELLGWMLALHSVWRLDILGWPPKRAAAAAGFSSTDRWASYIQTHVHARPGILSRRGFESLLDQGCRAIIRASRAASQQV